MSALMSWWYLCGPLRPATPPRRCCPQPRVEQMSRWNMIPSQRLSGGQITKCAHTHTHTHDANITFRLQMAPIRGCRLDLQRGKFCGGGNPTWELEGHGTDGTTCTSMCVHLCRRKSTISHWDYVSCVADEFADRQWIITFDSLQFVFKPPFAEGRRY